MERFKISDGHNTFTRISKAQARKRFLAGKPVYIIAAKMRPGYPFSMGMLAHPAEYIERVETGLDSGCPFDNMARNFTWYNCTYETGYYPAFYVEESKS